MACEKIELREINSVKEEWKEFRDAVFKCAKELYFCRRVGQGIRKGNEWWNGKVRITVV